MDAWICQLFSTFTNNFIVNHIECMIINRNGRTPINYRTATFKTITWIISSISTSTTYTEGPVFITCFCTSCFLTLRFSLNMLVPWCFCIFLSLSDYVSMLVHFSIDNIIFRSKCITSLVCKYYFSIIYICTDRNSKLAITWPHCSRCTYKIANSLTIT